MAKKTMKNAGNTTTTMVMAALEATVAAKIPVMLVGAPGTGKSATVKAMAKALDYELITLVGSRLDPQDVSGLPQGQTVEIDGINVPASVFLAPDWQVRVLTKKRVILFLDEWSNSPDSVRASFLTILQDREFPSGMKIPDETIVIGAMNPASQAADGYEMDLPTSNRLMFIPWSQSPSSWIEGMRNNWGKPCSDKELAWKHKIAGFIQDNPRWLERFPDDVETKEIFGVDQNDASQMEVFRNAWASGRSWDNLSRVLAQAPEDKSLQDMIAQGLVGYAAAISFREWLKNNDVISPQEVIADPQAVSWKDMHLDDSNYLLRSIVDLLDNDNYDNVMAVFHKVADDGRLDLGAPYLMEIIDRGLSPKMTDFKTKQKKLLELMRRYKSVSSNSFGQ